MPGDTSSWQPVDLAALPEQPAEQPTIGAGHTYPGRVHLRSGEPESGKTLASYIDCALELRAGRQVLVVDLEMGARLARDLFRSLGVTDFAGLAFVEPVEPLTAGPARTLVDELVAARRPSLVVIDSYSAALELHACDPHKGADIQRFHRQIVEPLRAAGAAITLIDHLVKNRETRGRYSVGSERKLAIVDVHLGYEAVKPLRRGHAGVLKITTHKDRIGALPRPHVGELALSSAPATHEITWALTDIDAGSTDDVADDWRPTWYMEQVSQLLERQTEPMPRGAIVEAIGRKRPRVLEAIDCLIADGYAAESAGPRGAKLTAHLHPFRVPDPFPPVPGNGTAPPVPAVPPPLGGNGSGNGSPERLTHDQEQLT